MGNRRVEVVFDARDLGVVDLVERIERKHLDAAANVERAGRTMDGAIGNLAAGGRARRDDPFAREFEQIRRMREQIGALKDGSAGKVADDLERASAGAERLEQGTRRVGQALLQVGNVPFRGALGGLLAGGLGSGLAIGGLAAIASFAIQKSNEMREAAERNLKQIESLANIGLRGPLSQVTSELEQLRRIREQIVFGSGSATGILKDQFGGQSFATLENQIAGAERRQKLLEDITGVTAQKRRQREREEARRREQLDQEALARSERLIQEFEAQERRRIEAARGAQEQIRTLRSQLDDNPFVALYDRAQLRQDEFLRSFSEVPEQIRNQFKELNDQLRSLEEFRAGLAGATRLNTLLSQAEVLRAGGGGFAAEQARADADRQSIIREIERRRGEGTLSGAEQFALLARLDAIRGPRQDSFITRQLESAQKALLGADTVSKERAALESIISATNDTSRLTSEQIDARMKALERNIDLQRSERSDEEKKEEAQGRRELLDVLNRMSAVLQKGTVITIVDKTPPGTVDTEVLGPGSFGE